jgi:hypothetical protein
LETLGCAVAQGPKSENCAGRPDAHVWILLALHLHDVPEPFCYQPNDIFIVNDQAPMFRYLSNWEIKIYQKSIPELSRYALQNDVLGFG